MAADDSGAPWEELRREARKLEGDLDVKLSSYAKLCSMLSHSGRQRGVGGGDGEGDRSAAAAPELSRTNHRMATCCAAGASAMHRASLPPSSHRCSRPSPLRPPPIGLSPPPRSPRFPASYPPSRAPVPPASPTFPPGYGEGGEGGSEGSVVAVEKAIEAQLQRLADTNNRMARCCSAAAPSHLASLPSSQRRSGPTPSPFPRLPPPPRPHSRHSPRSPRPAPTGYGEGGEGGSEGSVVAVEKAIEAQLQRLADTNNRMARCCSAAGGGVGGEGTAATASLSQKVARHRDILQEFTQVRGGGGAAAAAAARAAGGVGGEGTAATASLKHEGQSGHDEMRQFHSSMTHPCLHHIPPCPLHSEP
ncbi:unnamed protein product [Closterium sp. Naga37s-1]|nr:unnamed protein product [Closterium sp. Naga37s-1]